MALRGMGSPNYPKDVQRAAAAKGGRIAQGPGGKGHRFTPQEQRAGIAKVHALGLAHVFTSAKAKVAGRMGGLARAANQKAVQP